MPELLAPGVYVEETNFRARGVTGAVEDFKTAFIGPCRFGPTEGKPLLVTSFVEFRRLFGSLDPLELDTGRTTNYLAHAVRAFFENGGRQVYVTRVFRPAQSSATPPVPTQATASVAVGGVRFEARYPGSGGNLPIEISIRRSGNLRNASGDISGLRDGDFVQSVRPDPGVALDEDDIHEVSVAADGTQSFDPPLDTGDPVHRISVTVRVEGESYSDIAVGALGDLFAETAPPIRAPAVIVRDVDVLANVQNFLTELPLVARLTGGTDGAATTEVEFEGDGEGNRSTGLKALEMLEDVAIVAAPGSSALDADVAAQIRELLISHAENTASRMAILAGPEDADRSSILDVRSRHASSYAALYHPWIVIRDPSGGRLGEEVSLPPEGFVAGVFARTARERGVHKAPANEAVRGVLRFKEEVTRPIQDSLNPEGVNVLRSFQAEGRGNRIWGARTLSNDPLWQYVNVRRLFLFLRRSIDVSTQWVVFEPNNEKTWLKVRMGVDAFLMDQWREGALVGRTPQEAFFVACDRSTMSQTDLDNGRLVCVVGVAPTTPAEFVIFRIGQWTAQSTVV